MKAWLQWAGRLCGAAALALSAAPAAGLTIAAGDAGAQAVVLWVQDAGPGCVLIDISRGDDDGDGQRFVVTLAAEADHTARVPVRGLAAGAAYQWWARRVSCEPPVASLGSAVAGRFVVPPAPTAAAGVRLAFGADLAGQNVCRDRRRGFPIFGPLAAWAPEVFVALGDMIYADDLCRAQGLFGNEQMPGPGPAAHLDAFRAHWRYTRQDARYRAFLASALQVVTWDDHEVLDDFSPAEDFRADAPARRLLPAGRRALYEQNPLPQDGTPLYRGLRWGRNLELFVLDTRSHRAPAGEPDDRPRPKSMLGEEQRRWLEEGLAGSTARWKVIASPVPLAIPTGWPPSSPRDGWADGGGATGYERELVSLLRAAADAGVDGLVVLSADVHFASVLEHQPFPDEHPEFVVLEIVVGPLNAGLFPNPALDPTLNPRRLYWHAPPPNDTPDSFDEALQWMNFGVLDVDGDGRLTTSVVNGRGEVVFRRRLP